MTRRKPVDSVMRCLAWAAVLLCASGSANAQTSTPVEGVAQGPTTEKPEATTTEKAEPPQARAQPKPDGFTDRVVCLQAGRADQAGHHP